MRGCAKAVWPNHIAGRPIKIQLLSEKVALCGSAAHRAGRQLLKGQAEALWGKLGQPRVVHKAGIAHADNTAAHALIRAPLVWRYDLPQVSLRRNLPARPQHKSPACLIVLRQQIHLVGPRDLCKALTQQKSSTTGAACICPLIEPGFIAVHTRDLLRWVVVQTCRGWFCV